MNLRSELEALVEDSLTDNVCLPIVMIFLYLNGVRRRGHKFWSFMAVL